MTKKSFKIFFILLLPFLFSCKRQSRNLTIEIQAEFPVMMKRELMEKKFQKSLEILSARLNSWGHVIEKSDTRIFSAVIKAYDVQNLDYIKAAIGIKGGVRANILYPSQILLKINESDAARVIKKSHGKLIFIKSFQSDEGEVYGFAAYKRNIFEGLKIKSVFLTYFSKGRTYFPLVNIFFEEKYSLELKKRTSNLKNLLISFSLDGFSYAVSRIDTPAEGGVIKIAFKDIKLAEIFAKISESRTLPLGFKIIKTATEN